MHICCTTLTVPVVDEFLRDLRECVNAVKNDRSLNKKGNAAIYGMASSIPDKSIINEVAGVYLDTVTQRER